MGECRALVLQKIGDRKIVGVVGRKKKKASFLRSLDNPSLWSLETLYRLVHTALCHGSPPQLLDVLVARRRHPVTDERGNRLFIITKIE